MTRAVSWSGSVYQDGLRVAGIVCRYKRDAQRELAHYAAMYGQDGPVSVRLRKNVRRKARRKPK